MCKKGWQWGMVAFWVAVVGMLISCQPPIASHTSKSAASLILATTTSTQDSGLLDVLIPLFEQESGYKVKTIAVGTGQALKMGEEGNADVLLVHAPEAEEAFMGNGFGQERALVMHNDFILVGPPADPAKVKGSPIQGALRAIAASGALFISRGDDSGTHKMEMDLWRSVSFDPTGEAWYLESGQGMGATLTIASEKGAYTLTDRATYLANCGALQLEILAEGDKLLLNVYHIITVNPEKHPRVNSEGAKAFLHFITAPSTQKVIGAFGVEKYGQPLFTPDAHLKDADLGL